MYRQHALLRSSAAFLLFTCSLAVLANFSPAVASENDPLSAEQPRLLRYEPLPVTAAAPKSLLLDRQIKTWEIAIDLALLAENPDQLQIDLPGGERYVAYRTTAWTEEGQRRYWNGDLHRDGGVADQPAGRLTLAAEGEAIAGSLQVEGRDFEILPSGEGRQTLTEIATAEIGTAKIVGIGSSCRQAGEDVAAEGQPAPAVAELESQPVASNETQKGDPPVVVDVLAVFPQVLAGPLEVQTRMRILAWFADANTVLSNSLVNARFRAAYVGPLYGAQPPVHTGNQAATELGFNWISNQGPGSEVFAQRNYFGADLIAIFLPSDNDLNCGIAQTNNPATDLFVAIDIGCASGELLVAHELGHLLGMRHAAGEPGTAPPAIYPNARGYDNNNQLTTSKGGRAATVMACNGDVGGEPNPTTTGIQCNRLPYYSNPNITLAGMALGTTSANNAAVAAAQMPLTAQRLSGPTSTGNLPPQVKIVRPLGNRVQSQQTLTLAANAWDTEDGNLNSSILWTSNRRGTLGFGAQISVYSTSGFLGTETITATVTDSSNLSYSHSITVTIESMVVTDGAIWHDPGQPGKFLSFNKNIYDQWVATWFAYEGSNPVWYLSNVVPVNFNGSFATQLIRYTRNPDASQNATYFSDIEIRVETNRDLSLRLNPASGGQQTFQLEPFTTTSGSNGAYWSVFYNQNGPTTVDPGWIIFRGAPVVNTGGSEARLMITYDGAEPVWVFGLGSPPPFPTTPFGMGMYRPTPGAITNNFANPATGTVGSLVLTSTNTGYVTLSFPSGNTWIRNEQAIEPATIR